MLECILHWLLPVSQQAGEVLEKTSQTDSGAKSASKGVAKAVVNKSILDHKDKAGANATVHRAA